MSDQLIVNEASFETRIALLEGGVVTELMVERHADRGLVGNIYLGKVQRVLPGMQAAFVELGIGKAAFLYVGDVVRSQPSLDPNDALEEHARSNFDEAQEHEEEKVQEISFKHKKTAKERHKIEELLRPGQEILVQVTKDPIGTKGPRISCNISIPGRHVVFMPNYDHIGISRKIIEDEERERLKSLLLQKKPSESGFVSRTVSQGVADEKILADCDYLVSLWSEVQSRLKTLKAPALVQPELDILLKCARDMPHDSLSRIVVDSQEAYERAKKFFEIFYPPMAEKLELYDRNEPIFESFGVESEIARAMSRKVWLRSGGYLIIDQAEALTVIDINTGRFVGKRNLEDTILRTNLEAVREVAYQLRLRNIGGMVIVDFIDMETQSDRDKVLNALIEALKKDRARCKVDKISELGLVEMTRQRTRESLERRMCEQCFYCDGKGTLKSKQTIVYEIFRQLLTRGKNLFEPCIIVHAHPEVVDLVYGEEHDNLEKIEESIGKQIVVRPRGSFHQEQFDIFGASHLGE
ncbi:MAG: Rne/Rng family ribonuclease [Myxococcales bacterium]|nr:Rne/Rng family ribonuclease [Myxococcales bacterium]USN50383.1 MAG: Rne/Rng family ribonuclease [Myxococcales bacterium]